MKGAESLLKGSHKQEVFTSAQLQEHFRKKNEKRAKQKIEKPVFLKKLEWDGFPVKVNIVPLSVNQAWKGRRVRTDKYKAFAVALSYMLPNKIELPLPPYEVKYWFGLSSLNSDWDNPIKGFQDILSAKYGFNDKLIKKGTVEIEDVKKGKEYIRFEIVHFVKTEK